MGPLVMELQCFCQRHEEGDHGGAAAGMLAHLRHDWGEVPIADLPPGEDQDRSLEELALMVIRDVGEVADFLLGADDLEEKLGWARGNLIFDLERYVAASGTPA
jgi:hypothetical protein